MRRTVRVSSALPCGRHPAVGAAGSSSRTQWRHPWTCSLRQSGERGRRQARDAPQARDGVGTSYVRDDERRDSSEIARESTHAQAESLPPPNFSPTLLLLPALTSPIKPIERPGKEETTREREKEGEKGRGEILSAALLLFFKKSTVKIKFA